jgi:uncharacterized protein (TIGR03435 family)
MKHLIASLRYKTLVAITALPLVSQTPSRTAFDAVSIKLNTSLDNAINNRFGPEQFSWTNVTLRLFIQNIYRLKDYQLIGEPRWVNTDKWDIVARSDGASTFDQKYEMAKTLLAERFQLKFHRETRELPVYVLTATQGGA